MFFKDGAGEVVKNVSIWQFWNRRKYLQIIYLIENQHPEYVKKKKHTKTYNLIITTTVNIPIKDGQRTGLAIFQKRHTDGQQTHEKMLSVTNH